MKNWSTLLLSSFLIITACSSSQEHQSSHSTTRSITKHVESTTTKKAFNAVALLDSMQKQYTIPLPFSSLHKFKEEDMSAPKIKIDLKEPTWVAITTHLKVSSQAIIGLQPGYRILENEQYMIFTLNTSHGTGQERHGYLISMAKDGTLLDTKEIEYTLVGRDGIKIAKRYKIFLENGQIQLLIREQNNTNAEAITTNDSYYQLDKTGKLLKK